MPSIVFRTNRTHLDTVAAGRSLPTFTELAAMALTFGLTVFAWIFFRANSVQHAFQILSTIGSGSLFTLPQIMPLKLFLLLALFILIEWNGRMEQYAIAKLAISWPKPIRWGIYYSMVLLIFFFAGAEQQFIYFQF